MTSLLIGYARVLTVSHDPTDPIGRLLFTALSMIAESLELAELFSVSRATVYRAIQRGGAGTPDKTT